MLRKIFLISTLFTTLLSCGNDLDNLENKKAIGGVKYGGVFRFMSSEKIQTFIPLQATNVYTQRVTSQIFEPILKLDDSGKKVIPAIAESYKVSTDGKTLTLNIRKGVYFHPDDCLDGEGRELTAEDVKFCLDLACSQLPVNEISFILTPKVKGGKEFYNATKTKFKDGGVRGIKVTGRYGLKLELNEAYSGIDKLLTYSGFGIFPKEAYDTYGNDLKNHPVGTGPFMLEEQNSEHILLKRNPKYWAKDEFGNQLPYLAQVEVLYAKDKRSELVAFRNREIDLVLEIPTDEVENILGTLQEAQQGKTVKHKVDSKQSFSVSYLGLQHKFPGLDNLLVRKAFNLAVDRNYLVNTVLDGEGYPVVHGFIPNTEIYDASHIKGPKYNVAEAQALLAQAGFPQGKNFPPMSIYVSGKQNAEHHKLALGIAKQLRENLNIPVDVQLVPLEKRNSMVKNRKAPMWIAGWIADYPDPENFLGLFYGKHATIKSDFLNPFDYKNPKYDMLYDQVNREVNADKRMKLINQCDQILVDDAVLLPLTNGDFITMINARIRNFQTNSLETIDISSIFIKEPRGSEK